MITYARVIIRDINNLTVDILEVRITASGKVSKLIREEILAHIQHGNTVLMYKTK